MQGSASCGFCAFCGHSVLEFVPLRGDVPSSVDRCSDGWYHRSVELTTLSELRKPVYGTGEIGRLLNVSRIAVYQWIRSGKLRASRVPGGRYRVARRDFADFLDATGLAATISEKRESVKDVRILVVDDDPRIVETVKTFLERANPRFLVLGVTSGFDAGRSLASFCPSVLVLDLFMPGLDGFAVCRQVKSDPLTRHVRVVAMTAYPSQENVARIVSEGADLCLSKPFDYRFLVEQIERLAFRKP